MEKHLLSENIRSLADSVGIDAVGFTEASEFTSYALNYHQRRDPKLTLPNAKSIIIAGIYIGGVTLPAWENAWYGRTSRLYLLKSPTDAAIATNVKKPVPWPLSNNRMF